MNIEAKFNRPRPDRLTLTRPMVELPRGGIPGLVLALVAAVLAVLLFIVLNTERRRAALPQAQSEESGAAFVPPPALFVPPDGPPPGPSFLLEQPRGPDSHATPVTSKSPTAMPAVRPMIAPVQPAPVAIPRPPLAPPPAIVPAPPAAPPTVESGPALVIDSGTVVAPLAETPSGQPTGAPTATSQVRSDTRRAASNSKLADLTTTMATGTMIAAVLETPIDTSRPGFVRAIVSKDAPGYDGRRILIPRGSRLIGECQGTVRSGQSGVLVTWSRVILPDGRAYGLDSPAADSLGGAGIPGHSHSFFLARFFDSALQSALYVGESLLGGSSRTTIIVGTAAGAAPTIAAGGVTSGPQPRIKVASGALLNVYVAHDIDFSSKSAGR
jgi:type IV secretion system protein VirB10